MNYIFFDTETDSGRSTANILQINALFCSSDFKIISELNCEAKLRKSRIYEVDSFLVNNLDPFGDFDFLFSAAYYGEKISEYPVHYKARIYGKTQINRFRDGFKLIYYFFKSFSKFNSSIN